MNELGLMDKSQKHVMQEKSREERIQYDPFYVKWNAV